MMDSNYKPFTFDREYAPDGTVLRDGNRVKRYFTEDEVAEKLKAAAEEARKSEEAEAARITADILRGLSGKLQVLLTRMDEESKLLREDATQLAMAAAHKIAGKALNEYGEETIAECVREAMRDLKTEPRVAINVAAHLADPIADRLYEIADRLGFEGAVIVRADEETQSGDCSLEWRSGLIERSASEIEKRIEQAISNWLARKDDEPDTADPSLETPAPEPLAATGGQQTG